MKSKKSNGVRLEHLGPEARALFKRVREEWAVDDSVGVALVLLLAETHDEMRRAREILDKDGLLVVDRFGQSRPHPANLVLRDARRKFLEACRALNLDLNTLEDDCATKKKR